MLDAVLQKMEKSDKTEMHVVQLQPQKQKQAQAQAQAQTQEQAKAQAQMQMQTQMQTQNDQLFCCCCDWSKQWQIQSQVEKKRTAKGFIVCFILFSIYIGLIATDLDYNRSWRLHNGLRLPIQNFGSTFTIGLLFGGISIDIFLLIIMCNDTIHALATKYYLAFVSNTLDNNLQKHRPSACTILLSIVLTVLVIVLTSYSYGSMWLGFSVLCNNSTTLSESAATGIGFLTFTFLFAVTMWKWPVYFSIKNELLAEIKTNKKSALLAFLCWPLVAAYGIFALFATNVRPCDNTSVTSDFFRAVSLPV